jgi:plasmid stability protein
MSVTLSIKNVPDEVARALRNRAVSNQRTLQEELLHILKQAAKDAPSVSMDDLLKQASRQKPALDEATSRILAAKDKEQERTAKRFEDLLSGPDDQATR